MQPHDLNRELIVCYSSHGMVFKWLGAIANQEWFSNGWELLPWLKPDHLKSDHQKVRISNLVGIRTPDIQLVNNFVSMIQMPI